MDYMYIKMPAQSTRELGLTEFRRQTKDGHYLLNQDDLQTYGMPEDTLQDKITRLGGMALTADEAQKLL